MIRTNLFEETQAHKITAKKGCFALMEYDHDLSVAPEYAHMAYFASKMNIRKRQVIATLTGGSGVIVQAGDMQMMMGQIEASTNIQGAGDFMKKVIGSKVTGEGVIKPRYTGDGLVVLEPTYKYVLMEDLDDWYGNMVVEDGMFLACDDTIELKVSARKTISSLALGHEGIFNTCFIGKGTVVLESPVPAEEVIVVDMNEDILKIDGSMAIAWSDTLDFTVERTTKTLIGSAVSKEGLVNVYRGTGRVLIAPVQSNLGIATPETDK